jgi:hypothetical protein
MYPFNLDLPLSKSTLQWQSLERRSLRRLEAERKRQQLDPGQLSLLTAQILRLLLMSRTIIDIHSINLIL